MFYDVVIPDAFRNPLQKMPLDHDTDDFYANRCEAIDARLLHIEGADDAELREMIRDRWEIEEIFSQYLLANCRVLFIQSIAMFKR